MQRVILMQHMSHFEHVYVYMCVCVCVSQCVCVCHIL